MRVLILGAGTAASGSENSVWLAEHDRKVLAERFIDACVGLKSKLIFAVREQDIRRHSVDSVIRIADPSAVVVPISGETAGAACTALLCTAHILPEDELLILNSNEFLDIDYAETVEGFRARQLDAGVVCFRSLHPRYSYMLLDDEGFIIQASEKRPISRHATAGFYWFRRGSDFVFAAQNMIRKEAQVDGKFFISLTFNELILEQKRLGLTEVDPHLYIPLKSPKQVAAYESGYGEGT